MEQEKFVDELFIDSKRQYEIAENRVVLKVKKSPIIVRAFTYSLATVLVLIPFVGVAVNLIEGNGFHFGFLIGTGVFGLIAHFILRISLWNTYGKEMLKIIGNKLTYQPDYNWYKGKEMTMEINPLSFSIYKDGYEKDQQGLLVIGEGEDAFRCVTVLPLDQLEPLVEELNKRFA